MSATPSDRRGLNAERDEVVVAQDTRRVTDVDCVEVRGKAGEGGETPAVAGTVPRPSAVDGACPV